MFYTNGQICVVSEKETHIYHVYGDESAISSSVANFYVFGICSQHSSITKCTESEQMKLDQTGLQGQLVVSNGSNSLKIRYLSSGSDIQHKHHIDNTATQQLYAHQTIQPHINIMLIIQYSQTATLCSLYNTATQQVYAHYTIQPDSNFKLIRKYSHTSTLCSLDNTARHQHYAHQTIQPHINFVLIRQYSQTSTL